MCFIEYLIQRATSYFDYEERLNQLKMLLWKQLAFGCETFPWIISSIKSWMVFFVFLFWTWRNERFLHFNLDFFSIWKIFIECQTELYSKPSGLQIFQNEFLFCLNRPFSMCDQMNMNVTLGTGIKMVQNILNLWNMNWSHFECIAVVYHY